MDPSYGYAYLEIKQNRDHVSNRRRRKWLEARLLLEGKRALLRAASRIVMRQAA